jgi:Flp pilus assembly pilin Flp
MAEYVILAAFIAAVSAFAVTQFGSAVSGLFTGWPAGL